SDVPKAYSRADSSSSSSSSSSQEKVRHVSRRRRRRRHRTPTSSSSSSSSTSDSIKQRRFRKRRRRSSTSSSGSSSSSRPMWPKKKNNSTPSPLSSSTSSSSDESSHRNRSWRKCATKRNNIWVRKRQIKVRHGQADRSEQFYEPRPVSSGWTRQTFVCECGEKYGSQKALAHHILQNHDAEIPCFGCNETLSSLTKMLEHFRTKHTKSLIACVYCKSVFGKPNDMTENQWKRLKTHMYGELVYAKLAELQG
ncbi:unnamed protein product, partial [Cylicocyclus nassatus]